MKQNNKLKNFGKIMLIFLVGVLVFGAVFGTFNLIHKKPVSGTESDVGGDIEPVVKNYTGLEVMTWDGLEDFEGRYVWSDGVDTYYSKGSSQYVLDVENGKWVKKEWNGLSSFEGRYICSDGFDFYYMGGAGSRNYVLDVENSTWILESWTLNGSVSMPPYGEYVWCMDGVVYYSNYSDQCVLDIENHNFVKKEWNGLVSFDGRYVWSDGIDTYYSRGNSQYVLDVENDKWVVKKWAGLLALDGYYVWHHGSGIYYSNGSSQYVLDVENGTWEPVSWSGFDEINGSMIWSDGVDTYYSNGTLQCRFI